jgi:hypothetical protein
VIGLFAAAALQSATPPAELPAQYLEMNGAWVVDLSVDPAKPYTQPMVLTINPDRTVSGEFYQSTIDSGRAARNQGRICISFRTSDGVGPYYHAACLENGVMVGQSWAEHRKFVLPWSAKRKVAE